MKNKTETNKFEALRRCYGRMGINFYRPDLNIVKRYTPAGECVAIRFAAGTSEHRMRKSMERNPPTASDFRPYNEADNVFLP